MGLFTGLAIGGLVALNAAQALRRRKTEAPPLAPAPVAAITPPAPPTVLPGANQAAAATAGLKQRKRAAGGSLLTRPQAPISSLKPTGSVAKPRSLIGY